MYSAKFENKRVFVTGGAGGIGQSVISKFLSEGAIVIIGDIDEKAAKTICNNKKDCYFYSLDVSSEQNWEDIFSRIIKKFGGLDVFVNCAGVSDIGPNFGPQNPEEIFYQDLDRVFKVNFFGLALGCKFAIQAMKESGGSLINIASSCGLIGVPHSSVYAASKAAVINYTRSVSSYCSNKGYNIRCNSISPAAIETPMFEMVLSLINLPKEKLINKIPVGRLGRPEDVAEAVAYLASDESEYVNGINFIMDGGKMAGGY